MPYKRKKSRIKSTSQGVFPDGTPSRWNILHHTRPRRRRDKRNCYRILRGFDDEGLIWDLGNSKPHKYYW